MRKEPSPVMSTVAHFYPFVIGVDTHARTHTYAVLAANGAHLGTEAFPNTHTGRTRAIAWPSRRTGGDLEALWAIEGTRSYGALLTGTVARAGYRVVEAPRVRAYASARRGVGQGSPIRWTLPRSPHQSSCSNNPSYAIPGRMTASVPHCES